MTPIATNPDAAPVGSAARHLDFAARLKGRLRTLRARLERRETMLEAIREAHATLNPVTVAEWLIRQAEAWVPAPCWSVITRDDGGQPVRLADRGCVPEVQDAALAAGDWVLRNGAHLLTANLAQDSRVSVGVRGTVVGLPLICRGRTVGVLVGFDPAPSSSAPVIGASIGAALATYLEAVAVALDNALTIQRAEALAVIDDLTRLYNSRFLDLSLRREAKRALRSDRPVSLLFIDLDEFKQVNDTYGHMAGSLALVEVGAILRACARETDVVARFGGDEFAIILPDTDTGGGLAVAGRVRDRLTAARFLAAEGASVRLTASIGVATLPDVAGSAEELLRAADKAMYRVKESGKNGIHLAQQDEARSPVSGRLDRRS